MNKLSNLHRLAIGAAAAMTLLANSYAEQGPAPDGLWNCSSVTFKDGTNATVSWVPNCAGSFHPDQNPAPGNDLIPDVNLVMNAAIGSSYVPVNFQYKDNIQKVEVGSDVSQIDFESSGNGKGSVTFGASLFDPFVLTIKFGQQWSAYLFDVDVQAGTTWNFTTSSTQNGLGLSHGSLLTVAAIPEPGTYALMGAGLAAVGFVARRRKSQRA